VDDWLTSGAEQINSQKTVALTIERTRRSGWRYTLVLPSALMAQWPFLPIGSYSPTTGRSGEPMNSTRLSIFFLLGLIAVARADPSTEANIAIEADLARAQAALAQHNLSAVVDALDDTKKYWSDADEKTLQELSAFQDRVRETLTATATQPTVLSSPAVPPSAPSPPNHAAAPDQAPSGSFTEQAASAPTQPAAPQHKSESKITLRSTPPRAAGADPSTEANLAIEADLARAQAALARHNLSAVLDTLNDTLKYLSNADEKTLQELIVFQDRVRETLTATATQPTVLPSPGLPASAPSPPNQAAAPYQAPSGSFTGQTTSALTKPAARQDKSERDVTLRLPRALAATAPDAGPVARPHAAGQAVATAVVPRVAAALAGGASARQLAPRRAFRKSAPEVALARQSGVGPVENPSQPDPMPAPKAPSAAPMVQAVAQLESAGRALQDNDADGARDLLEAAETAVVFAPAGDSRANSAASARVTEALRMVAAGDRERAMQCVAQALAAFESPPSVGASPSIVQPAGATADSPTGMGVAGRSRAASAITIRVLDKPGR
jgi:hypothetical protein